MEPYWFERKTECSVVRRRGDTDGVAENVVNLNVFWSTVSGFLAQPHPVIDHTKCTYGKLPAGCSPYEGTPDRGQ